MTNVSRKSFRPSCSLVQPTHLSCIGMASVVILGLMCTSTYEDQGCRLREPVWLSDRSKITSHMDTHLWLVHGDLCCFFP